MSLLVICNASLLSTRQLLDGSQKMGGVPVEVCWISETISEVHTTGIPIDDEMNQPL